MAFDKIIPINRIKTQDLVLGLCVFSTVMIYSGKSADFLKGMELCME
jgi:hypothetical protein